MNVPIVTTNVGIANSIINDFRNGFIVDVNCEEEEFRNKVKYALEHIQDVDNSSMNNLYSWQTYGRITANCYSSILNDTNIILGLCPKDDINLPKCNLTNTK